MGQTVNLLAYAFRGSNPLLPNFKNAETRVFANPGASHMKKPALFVLLLAIFFLAPFAQAQGPSQIEIVFDASGSMNEISTGVTKMDTAKKALTTIANQIPTGSSVGLRVFGVTPVRENIRESCTDSRLLIPIGQYDATRMISQVQPLKSYGMTALGYSLEKAGTDFAPAQDVKKSIILISDGEETCGKDPVEVMKNLKAQGIDITIHAIGFGATEAAKGQLRKLAEMSQGSYREAEDADSLQQSLQEVVQKEMLLTAQRGAGASLIDASEGGRIVSSSTQEFAKLIDGSEEKTEALYPGQEAVFSFKDNQPALIEKFAVPIFRVYDYNPGEISLSGSTESPTLGFFPIASFKVENKVFFGNVYQEFKIDPPAAVRYLKVVVGAGPGGHSYHTEWKAYGKLLSEDEFAEEVKKAPAHEINILAAEYGGRLIAASNMKFSNLIDGKSGGVGEAAGVEPGQEAIFGFSGGKTATITKVAVPVFEASQYNCKTIEFYVSTDAPTGEYTKVGGFETTNMVFATSPYQEYTFDAPVQAKYLKVKIVNTHGMYYCSFPELQAFGKVE